MKINKSRIQVRVFIALILLQVLVVLLSWIVSTAWPDSGVESLLSGKGIRWMLHLPLECMQGRDISYLFITILCFGILAWSRLLPDLFSSSTTNYRQRFASKVALGLFFASFAALVIATVYPHSLLLGVSGKVVPGPLTASLFPIFCGVVAVCSEIYCMISGKVKTMEDFEYSLIFGLQHAAFPLIIYVMFKQFVKMLGFIA